jgi:hypothetical protein
VLPSSYRKHVPHLGQNPLGRRRVWEAASASSYTSFSAKGKAKSAAAWFAAMLNLFSHATNYIREVGPKSLLKARFCSLLLGGAALHRCHKRPIFTAGFTVC